MWCCDQALTKKDDVIVADSGPWKKAGLTRECYENLLSEFTILDANDDHTLSRKEFDNLSRLPTFLEMSREDIRHLFDTVDVNHDGAISMNEFVAYMAKRKDHIPLPVQRSATKKYLEDNMEHFGFQLCTTDGGRKGVAGDGNCQFYSLSWHLYQTTANHTEVRSKIIEYFQGPQGADLSVFYVPEFPSQPETFEEYIDLMAKDRTWGDQLTLKAAADVFDLCVHVITADHYDPAAKPDGPQAAGRSYGCVSTLLPSTLLGKPKDVWISFAAQHYSPVQKR